MKSILRTSTATLSLLAAAAVLSACQRADDHKTVGQKVDAAVAQTERKAEELGADARKSGKEVSQAVNKATDAVVNTSADMAITAAIKGKLATDDKLSALSINVDTVGGRVVLRGSAPDAAAKSHATQLAKAVDGVSDVSNELSVQPGK